MTTDDPQPTSIRLINPEDEDQALALLVAQAVRSRTPAQVRRYIEELQGAEASIFDYLASEVFEAQPLHVQEFLKHTALPDSFTPQLAQELVPSCQATDLISHLKLARLFLIPLEREGEWYRYHHLFRDFLRSKMVQDRGRGVVESLHQTVANWLLTHDEVVAAIPHFLASGDSELAADVLERVGSDLLHRGLRTSVARWIEAFPAAMRSSRPGMQVLQAELSDLQGNWHRAVEGYRTALQMYRDSGETLELATVLEKLSFCYIKYGESKKLLETCEEGLRLCPADNLALRTMLEAWLGATLINGGIDWTRGYALLRSSHTLAYESADPRAISWACLTYAFAYHFPQGNFEEALRTLNEGIDFFTRLGWPMVLYQLAMNKAVVLIARGDPERAMALVEETLIQAKRAGHSYVEKGLETLRGRAYLESGRHEECRASLDRVAQGEIPAQFKPWFFRDRMLLNCHERNFGQARVDAEEMERALLLNGSGMYAPECFVSLAYLLIQLGDIQEAHHRLEMNLRLCESAQAKFWQMKTWQLLAWEHYTKGNLVKLRIALEHALALTQTNDYGDYWLNDSWKISIPLLVAAVAYQAEAVTAERLLARLSSRWADAMEELVLHPDSAIRKVAIRYVVGHSSKDMVKSLLKQVYRNDPDVDVREAARKTLKLPENGNRLQICCFGALRICMEGEDFDYARSIKPMAQKLLKFFLAQADRVIATDRILEGFWPDLDPERGRHNLATHLSTIRRNLGTQVLFPRNGEGYRLCNNGDVHVDVLEFERYCRLAAELTRNGEQAEAVAAMMSAEQCYRGDFLEEDLYEDWIDWRRRELREQYDEVLEMLGDHFSRMGEKEQALMRYRKLLDPKEPQERIFHKVFRCYEALGDRQGARKEYETFRARLKESLGLEPQPATRALIEALFLQP